VGSVADPHPVQAPQPYQKGKPDPNPHRSGKLDPDRIKVKSGIRIRIRIHIQSEKVEALEDHFGVRGYKPGKK